MSTDLDDLARAALAARAVLATPRHQLGAVLRDSARRPAAIDPGLITETRPFDAPRAARQANDGAPRRVRLGGRARGRSRVAAVLAVAAAIIGIVAVGLAAARGGGADGGTWGGPEPTVRYRRLPR